MKIRIKRPATITTSLSEIHEYANDLQRITLLRDKCQDPKEREDYTTSIHRMQEVLVFLNDTLARQLEQNN